MNEKLAAIHWLLHRECPGRLVRYVPTREFHSFRLEGAGPTHWVHLPRGLVVDLDADSLERLIMLRDCIGRLNAASKPIRLCILSGGACEVGDRYLAHVCECEVVNGLGARKSSAMDRSQAQPPACAQRLPAV